MKTMTNAQMWESIQTLTGINNETGKLGYACARNLRKLMDACKEYMEIRDRLMMEYGTSEGNGKFTFTPEKAQLFTEAIKEYALIEHDVDVYQVSEDVFCSGKLTSKEMYALGWMVADTAQEATIETAKTANETNKGVGA